MFVGESMARFKYWPMLDWLRGASYLDLIGAGLPRPNLKNFDFTETRPFTLA